MNYTVVWKAPAKKRLAEIWLAAADRSAVSHAADEIDARLRRSPLDEGESREAEHRIAFIAPLAVEYSGSEPDRLVSVVHVRLI
jgi:hypothetical protein